MPESEEKGRSALVTILLALIPVLGGLLTVYLQNQPQQTALQLTATADARIFSLTAQALTAQASGNGEPTIIVITATPNPDALPQPSATASPVPTVTATPAPSPTPRPLPGDDFGENCISASLWRPFPNVLSTRNGCWNADGWGIYAYQGGLRLSVHQPSAKTVGFFSPIGSNAEVSFSIRVNQMRDRIDNAQIDVFVGFGAANSLPGSWVGLRKSTNSSNIYIVHGNYITGKTQTLDKYIGGQTINLRLLRNGNFITVYQDDVAVLVDVPVPAEQLGDRIWVGYQIPHNADVEITLVNFRVTER